MNVWLMNLKDNRDEANKPSDLTKSKFQFCLEHKIVGIGWVDQEPDNAAFARAQNALSEFEAGDLVWVRDPNTQEYYLCRITASAVSTQDEEWNRQDIGQYCACEFFRVGAAESLPEEIARESLISRSTISRADDLLSEQTKTFFETVVKRARKKFPVKRLLLVCAVVVLLGAAVTGGFFLYKEIVRLNHPVLPYDLQMGDTYETVQKSVDLVGTKQEDKANKRYSNSAFWSAEDVKAFYQNDQLAIEGSNPVSYYFNQTDQLFEMDITITSDEACYEYLLDYYATALDVKTPEKTDSVSLYEGHEYFVLENQTLEVDLTVMPMGDGKFISITINSKAFSPYFHEVPKSVINDAFDGIRYHFNGSANSIDLGLLLTLCAPGYEGEYEAYRDYFDLSVLNVKKQDELENSEYGDYLSTSYIIKIKGDISQSPDSRFTVDEDADILTMLMVFDESDQFIGYQILQEHPNLRTYALQYAY